MRQNKQPDKQSPVTSRNNERWFASPYTQSWHPTIRYLSHQLFSILLLINTISITRLDICSYGCKRRNILPRVNVGGSGVTVMPVDNFRELRLWPTDGRLGWKRHCLQSKTYLALRIARTGSASSCMWALCERATSTWVKTEATYQNHT